MDGWRDRASGGVDAAAAMDGDGFDVMLAPGQQGWDIYCSSRVMGPEAGPYGGVRQIFAEGRFDRSNQPL